MTIKEAHDAKSKSLIITAICGIAALCLLFIHMKFYKDVEQTQPIEIAMNFGSSDVGGGIAEPKPITIPLESNSSKDINPVEEQTESTSEINSPNSSKEVITQNKASVNTKKANSKEKESTTPNKAASTSNTKETAKKDARANDALAAMIGGKGKANTSGQGNNGTSGNIGDPKGKDSNGTGIGREWKTKIPMPQRHDCNASGTIVVNITVDGKGKIKKAIPGGRGSTSNDECLREKAVALVRKYVSAYPGDNNRTGTYDVILK